MVDRKAPKSAASSAIESAYPSFGFPTIFADGVVNLSRGPGLVKFYLYRLDPSFSEAQAPPRPVPFVQAVMPVAGFAQMVLFFNQQLEALIEGDFIKPEVVQAIRDTLNASKKPTST